MIGGVEIKSTLVEDEEQETETGEIGYLGTGMRESDAQESEEKGNLEEKEKMGRHDFNEEIGIEREHDEKHEEEKSQHLEFAEEHKDKKELG